MLFSLLAPMPPGIAYNPQTKECGYYMGGDEYASYLLPEPWVVNYGDPIENETGTYQWDGRHDSIETFCAELGYTFIPGNIASQYGREKKSPVFYLTAVGKALPYAAGAVVLLIAGLILKKTLKKRKN